MAYTPEEIKKRIAGRKAKAKQQGSPTCSDMVGSDINETIIEMLDAIANITDGEGTETFENVEVTVTATIEDIVAVTTQTEDAIVTNILTVDTINEVTANAGVTIDGILIKDSLDVSNIIDKTTSQTISGAKTFSNASGVITDVITERTATAGVTIDGVLLKDGGVSANSMFAGFYPIGAEQALAGPGAINLTSYNTKFTSTGTGDALTLANGSQIGQKKKVMYVAEGAGGDTGVLTLTGYTSITFNAINDYAILMWNGTAWFVLESVGVTIV